MPGTKRLFVSMPFSRIAFYDTRSLPGHLYRHIVLPFHHYIFDNLIRQIERRS